ncbi:MAG: ABC transporter permease, partial [Halobacteriaceae archaeon]
MKFRYYVTRRLLLTVVVLFGIAMITFSLTHLVPSNPAALWAGAHATEEQIEQARKVLGLNKPIYIQFIDYIWDLLHGNLGTSIRTEQPVSKDIARFFPATFELVTVGMIIATGLGIPLGIIS